MKPGKLASQACHAAKNCVLLASRRDPELLRVYQGPDFIGTQIILKAKNQGQLERAHEAALEAGLITSLIIDKTHVIPGTEFDGNPIVTALGIGPCTQAQAHAITKRFSAVE
jgi:peptidyl-tRNA hydrolase